MSLNDARHNMPHRDCFYITLNQKVITTQLISKRAAEKPDNLRQRVSIAKTWKTRLLRCQWASLTRSTIRLSLSLRLWCVRSIQLKDNLTFTSWWQVRAAQILMLKSMLITLRNPTRRFSRPASPIRHSSNTNKVTIKSYNYVICRVQYLQYGETLWAWLHLEGKGLNGEKVGDKKAIKLPNLD
jgi:hypothetical protein